LQLWSLCDENLRLKVKKNSIPERFLCSQTRVRNDSLALVREGLISISENKNEYIYELVGWEDDEEAY
jgi:hypothetical protein